MLLCLPLFAVNANAAIDHGSVKGTGLPFYAQYNAGTLDPLTVRAGVTFDFKVVTIGSKTWGWTNTNLCYCRWCNMGFAVKVLEYDQ